MEDDRSDAEQLEVMDAVPPPSLTEEIPESNENYFCLLPVEIFLHICSFLDTKKSLLALSKVCKQFNKLLSDDYVWRSRIAGRWLPYKEEQAVDWRAACVCIDQEAAFLRAPPTLLHFRMPEAHFSDSHALHIVEGCELCITGSRDQDMAVWRLDGDVSCTVPVYRRLEAHKGWVWRITSRSPHEIFSCSFDYTVKHWKLTPTELTELLQFKCGKAVMSIQLLKEHGLIAAGLMQGVVLLDERQGDKPVHTICAKKQNQLALAAPSPHLLAVTGVNRTITLCDLRNYGEIESKFSLCEFPTHPQCMSTQSGLLYIGDTSGQLHMVDVSSGEPVLLQTYTLGHKENLMAISSSYTTLVTASSMGNIRFWRHQPPPPEWDNPYRPLCTVGILKPDSEFCAMHFRDNVLAASFSRDCAINYWMPR